jgi:UDP-N-acetylmuramate dehydrogenase
MHIKELPKIRGEYREDYKLNNLTWIKIGGPCSLFVKPLDLEDLVYFLQNKPDDMIFNVLGAGSNVVFNSDKVKSTIIKLGRGFNYIEILESTKDYAIIKAGASVLNFNLVHFAIDNSLKGIEGFISIPGTVGGGIAMNAGAYGVEYKDVLLNFEFVDYNGNVSIINAKDINLTYRSNPLKNQGIFTSATMKLFYGSKTDIIAKTTDIIEKRKQTQPVKEKTCGSTFMNPSSNLSAWQVVHNLGYKDTKIGGVSFSEMHSNFLINDGSGTSEDVLTLTNMVIESAKNAGIILKREIIFIN